MNTVKRGYLILLLLWNWRQCDLAPYRSAPTVLTVLFACLCLAGPALAQQRSPISSFFGAMTSAGTTSAPTTWA